MDIMFCVIYLMILPMLRFLHVSSTDPFEEFQKSALASNPVREASHRVGYGSNSIQPYYVCDRSDSGSALPLSAWHYSCKQSCKEDNEKTHIKITSVKWEYIGEDITVYKITANKVCYTSHENIWGYCTQSQTTVPTDVTEEDRKSLPDDYHKKGSKVLGVTYIVNSVPADCSYISDNTVCKKDFMISYRAGKLSQKSDSDPLVLNIYGDGIRTDPRKGSLENNNAAWFWNVEDISSSKKCGWTVGQDLICKITSSSETMHCPDVGYQYNIHTLKATKTCIGDVYDKDGPLPFRYSTQNKAPNRTEIMNKAKEGKGDPDVNMITGINAALDEMEETYCASSCDLFAKSSTQEESYVMDTPVGNWRVIQNEKVGAMLSPCKPTSTWRMKNPTMICHGKDHLLVEDSATHHTCSWDITKDFIIIDDICNGDQIETDKDAVNFRNQMASNKDISFHFWTGDDLVIKPPYDKMTWEKTGRDIPISPGWFSKVEINKGMLHNQQDISNIMTSAVHDTKTEIAYNKTKGKNIRTLIADEILGGAADMGNIIWSVLASIMSAVPKFILLIAACIMLLAVLQQLFSYYMRRRINLARNSKHVSFETGPTPHDAMISDSVPTAPKRRALKRSSVLARELNFI